MRLKLAFLAFALLSMASFIAACNQEYKQPERTSNTNVNGQPPPSNKGVPIDNVNVNSAANSGNQNK